MSVTLTLVPAAAQAPSEFERVGTLDWGSGNLKGPGSHTTRQFADDDVPPTAPVMLVDPGLQRGMALTVADPDGETEQGLRVYDLAAMEPIADVATDMDLSSTVHALDPVNHRLFMYDSPGLTSTCPFPGGIHVLDIRTLEFDDFDDPCSPVNPARAANTYGLWYDQERDHLYQVASDTTYEFAAGTFVRAGRPLAVRRLDPDTGEVAWTVSINPPCATWAKHSRQQMPIVRAGDAVYVECRTVGQDNYDGMSQGLTLRIPLDGEGDPQCPTPTGRDCEVERDITMNASELGLQFDPAGTELLVSNQGGLGVGAFVKDVDTGLFAGLVGTGSTTEQDEIKGWGLDQDRGRLYLRTPSELLVSDVRQRPLPQGLPFEELADRHSQVHPGPEYPIPVDPERRLVFLPNVKDRVWEVHRDDVPQQEPSPPPDVDERTADIDEAPGETDRTVSGSANAFGALFLEPGGPTRTAVNRGSCSTESGQNCPGGHVIGTGTAPLFGVPIPEVPIPESPFADGNRVWYFGHVADLALSNSESSTLAAPVHLTDTATHQDLRQEPAASLHDAMVERGWWPGGQVQCSDFGADEPVSDGTDTPLGDAEVTCRRGDMALDAADEDTPETSASAVAGEAAVSGAVPVSFASAESNVESYLDDERGNVTEVSASTYGVEIGPVRIGEITTTATTVAHGRPGTAKATFTRTISGVTAPGFSCDQQCDPHQVAEVLDEALGLWVEVRVPGPDGAYHPDGSDGGYQALVTKHGPLQVSDLTVNADPTDTVVGLQVIGYTDGSAGRSRQIFQFAGVHAESHYGIFPLGNFDFDPSGGADTTTGGEASGSTGPADPADTPATTSTDDATSPDAPAPVSSGRQPSVALDSGNTDAEDPAVAPGDTSGGSQPVAADQAVTAGWRLFVSDPATAGALAAMLAVLFVPVYLRGRRFSLLAAR